MVVIPNPARLMNTTSHKTPSLFMRFYHPLDTELARPERFELPTLRFEA